MKSLVLKKGKERSLRRRHPWVYETAVEGATAMPDAGETVKIVSKEGQFLAYAAFSPGSTICARCWSFDEADVIDKAWFEKKLQQAFALREPLQARTSAVRLVFAENDGLPGLIVDRYADTVVTQFLSHGAEAHREIIEDLLWKLTRCQTLFDRSDANSRFREGLPPAKGLRRGVLPAVDISVVEDGVHYGIDIFQGHKTGFYIDQRESRLATQWLANTFRKREGRGMRALNCFCYTGGFSLALMRGGADEVVSVDSSEKALDQARRNWLRNRFDSDRGHFICADVFEYLRAARQKGETFDLIILDPPKFASSHRHVDQAARAYKDINLAALQLLRPGGQLLTFSCSGAIDQDLFQKIVAGAVFDAKVDALCVGRFSAGLDHPVLMTFPEGEYLKGLHLVLRPSAT